MFDVSSWWKNRAVKLLFGFVLIIVVLMLGLQVWLTSGIGRDMVESRLSSSMGRPVRLAGDFTLDIFPIPGAAGSDLQIFSRDGQMLLLSAGEYMAQLALWPLLKGEVEVIALHVTEAAVDVGVLAGEEATAESSGEPFPGLPSIQNFALTDSKVYFDGMGSDNYLRISGFVLEDFMVDALAAFRSEIQFVSGDTQRVAVEAKGQLTLHSQGDLDVDLSGMSFGYDNWLIEDLRGAISADLVRSILNLNLRWTDGQQQVGIESRLGWAPEFPAGLKGALIEHLALDFNGHAVTGQGCLLQAEPPQLHLELVAPTMKLDEIGLIAEKWKTSASSIVDSTNSEDDLPVELAVRLVIDQASHEDTLAEGVRITMGDGPNCPEAL